LSGWAVLSNVVRPFALILCEGILEERLIVVGPAENASSENRGPAGRYGPSVWAVASFRA